MGNIFKYVLLSLIIVVISAKYYHLTKKESTGIDVMGMHLATAKNLLPVNSSIGFYTNDPLDSARIIYSYVAFVLHPVIIKPGNSDTVLMVVDKRHPTANFKGYLSLMRNEDSHFIYSLIKKDK